MRQPSSFLVKKIEKDDHMTSNIEQFKEDGAKRT